MTNNISVTIKCAPEYIRVCNSVAVSAASVAGLDIEAMDCLLYTSDAADD